MVNVATKFNKQQELAVYTKENNVLVAAGAGSGKTTVLIERILQKILQDGMNVDELLVLTFTNLAAREMKERLRLRLTDELAKQPQNEHLQRQLYQLPLANISTFHTFCFQIVKRYYYLVDLDVTVSLMDDGDALALRDDVLEAFLDDQYHEEDFLRLVHTFAGDRSDMALGVLLMKLYELARANPNMDQWLDNLSQLYRMDDTVLEAWHGYEDVLRFVKPLLETAKSHLEEAREFATASQMTDLTHGYLAGVYDQDLALLQAVTEQLSNYEAVCDLLQQTKIANFPAIKKNDYNPDLHEQAKKAREKFKEAINTLKSDFFVYTNASHAIHFEQGEKLANLLAKAVKDFDDRFFQAKKEQNRLDFSDLERLTLQILTNQEANVLEEVATTFHEIMIDEYQDTNEMQEYIANLIKEAGSATTFMVGDVKQSIYRFRLAEPAIFQNKYNAFKDPDQDGLKIDLMENYRSSKEVIDGTNYVFEHLMDEEVAEISYDEDAALKVGVEEAPDDFNTPEVHLIDKSVVTTQDVELENFTDAELEAHHVAQRLVRMVTQEEKMWDRKLGQHRPLQYSDVVILMRSMTASSTFYGILSDYGIPVKTEVAGNLLEETEIVTVLSALWVVDNPYQDIPLVATLRSPLFFFSESELAVIKTTTSSVATFYEAVKHYPENGKNSTLIDKVCAFLNQLHRWRFDARSQALVQTLRTIYDDTSYDDFVLGLTSGKLRRANLDLLLQLADDFQTRRTLGLSSFLRHLDHLQALGKTIPKAHVEETTSGVKIMTIHKSKGLEFPLVILAGIQKQFNVQDEIGDYILHKNYGIGMKYIDPELRLKQKNIAGVLLAKTLRQEMLAEEMRLLYVALTRAKTKLILTGVIKNLEKAEALGAKDIRPAHVRSSAKSYLDWLLPVLLKKTPRNPWHTEEVTALKWPPVYVGKQEAEVKKPPAVDLEAIFNRTYAYEELTTMIAKQSVSQRKEEETVPLFKGIPEKVDKVAYDRPSFMESEAKATEVGTALHQYMQHLPLHVNHTMESLTAFKEDLVQRKIIKSSIADRINLGDVLNFINSDLFARMKEAKQIKRELPFTMLIQAGESQIAKAMLQGVIDMLVEFDNEVWIVDYKTDHVNNFELEESMLRRRYDIQMKYYLQAMADLYPGKKVTAHVYFMRVGRVVEYG